MRAAMQGNSNKRGGYDDFQRPMNMANPKRPKFEANSAASTSSDESSGLVGLQRMLNNFNQDVNQEVDDDFFLSQADEIQSKLFLD